jgi:hypothetical protein
MCNGKSSVSSSQWSVNLVWTWRWKRVGLRLYKQSCPLRHVIVFFFIRKHVSFQALLSVNTHNPIFRLLRLFFTISANLSIKESLKLINKTCFRRYFSCSSPSFYTFHLITASKRPYNLSENFSNLIKWQA